MGRSGALALGRQLFRILFRGLLSHRMFCRCAVSARPLPVQPSGGPCPMRTPPAAPVEEIAWRRRAHTSTTPTRILPHRDLHLRPQWRNSHGDAAFISAHPSRGSCPTGSSTYAPTGRVRMQASSHVGTPLTRIVSPQGAPPAAPAGAAARGPPPFLGPAPAAVVPRGKRSAPLRACLAAPPSALLRPLCAPKARGVRGEGHAPRLLAVAQGRVPRRAGSSQGSA